MTVKTQKTVKNLALYIWGLSPKPLIPAAYVSQPIYRCRRVDVQTKSDFQRFMREVNKSSSHSHRHSLKDDAL